LPQIPLAEHGCVKILAMATMATMAMAMRWRHESLWVRGQ
jgi:hypothetical protein